MALIKSVTTSYGVNVVDAYHRIEMIHMYDKKYVSYHVRSYKDASGLPFFEERVLQFAYDLNGSNPFAQAYDHLKTQPEFDGAVDC